MSKLTVPIEKHLAYPVFAQTAQNDKHFEKSTGFKSGNVSVFTVEYKRNNLLLPNGGQNYTSELEALGLLNKSKKGYDVTEKGEKVLKKVIIRGDFSAWAQTRKILTENPNPTNIDVLIYLNNNGSTSFSELEKNLSQIYSKNKIDGKISFYRRIVGNKDSTDIKNAVEHNFYHNYISANMKIQNDLPEMFEIPRHLGENDSTYYKRISNAVLGLNNNKELDLSKYGKYELEKLQEIANVLEEEN